MFPLVLGPCGGCGEDNKYSARRLADYQARGFILTTFCICCCFKQREVKKRAAALGRPDEEAMATAVKDAETVAEI